MSTTAERERVDEAPSGTSTPMGRWIVAGSCALFLAQVWVLRGFVADDSWISVRYAENLGSGAGWGWNRDAEPVEGFSNPLLVLFEALAHALGLPTLASARLLGVVAGLGCVLVVYVLGRRVVGETAAAMAAVLTATCAPLALWSVGGLETSIVTVLLTAAALELARADRDGLRAAAWLLAPLPWLRPEALVVAGALLVAAHLMRPWRRPVVRSLLLALAPMLVSQLLLQVVRWVVYGNVVPNSALYKVGTGDALEVPLAFLGQHAPLLALALLGAWRLRGRQRLLLVAPVIYVLGSIGTMDSANGWSRFLVPVVPQVAVVAGVLVAAVLSRNGARQSWWRTLLTAAVLAVAAVALLPTRVSELDRWQQTYNDCKVSPREEMVDWLLTTPPDTSFAISDAGLVPARAGGRPAIDSFLLNEAVLQETGQVTAAERADRVHDKSPDAFILASTSATRFDGVYKTDQLIHDDPRAADYSLELVSSGGAGCDYALWAFQR